MGKTRPDPVSTQSNQILPDPLGFFKLYLHWIWDYLETSPELSSRTHLAELSFPVSSFFSISFSPLSSLLSFISFFSPLSSPLSSSPFLFFFTFICPDYDGLIYTHTVVRIYCGFLWLCTWLAVLLDTYPI